MAGNPSPSWHSPRYRHRHPEATVVAKLPEAPKLPIPDRNMSHKLLDFIEQPLFTLPVGIVGGIVGVLLFAPVLVVCGVCVILAFHRAKVVAGKSIMRVQTPSYALLSIFTIASLYGVHHLIQHQVADERTGFFGTIKSAVSEVLKESKPTVIPSPPAVPSLEWRPLAVTAALGKDFNLDYDDKSPSDLILVFEGAVVNSGAPSSTFRWEAKLVLPDDTVPVLGYLIVSPPTNPTATWSLRTPDGHQSPRIPFRQGSLPESTASKAITQGDSQTGFAIFAFHGLQKKWFKPRALNGAKVTISFYDTAKRQTVFDWVLPDQHGQFTNDITSEKTPGMPTLH
jgi:hypothetical protein